MRKARINFGLAVSIAFTFALLLPSVVRAHCDSLDGPVVSDARAALKNKDITPLLKWVRPQDEGLIRDAFIRTLAVRDFGPEAKELADSYFFETVVRIHRAGEGAPYTGLKAAGTMLPAVREADEALVSGSVEKLAKAMGEHAAQGVRERFARAAAAKARASQSPEAGREYVETYVGYIHFVEGLANVVHGTAHEETAEMHRP